MIPSRLPVLAAAYIAAGALTLLVASGCGGTNNGDENGAAGSDEAEVSAPEAAPSPSPDRAPSGDTEPDGPAQPQPFIAAGRVGDPEAYADLIRGLEAEIPAELRSQVPWPDLRVPDPVAVQSEIFEMWIWMTENYPDPVLIDVLAHPDGPTRGEVAGIFGNLHSRDEIEIRTEAPYRAFDHLVVTFESAGLPLWLARDVPEDAVVIYYSDNSGPVEIRDRQTGEVHDSRGAIATRTWLSIMVPTDVGWLLWRDELIEPDNSELEVPDLDVPSPDAGGSRPEV